MTCCVIALALAMQIIEGWRRLKRLCGIETRARPVASRGVGTLVATALERLRLPYLRYAVFMLLAVEGAAAGTWLYGHRDHVEHELAAAVFATTGFGFGLCDADPATVPRHW